MVHRFLTVLGGILCDHGLVLLLWLAVVNLLIYALIGEDENRVAHRKPRYSPALLAIVALLGGALGAFLGFLRFRPKGKTFLRATLSLILLISEGWLIAGSIIAADGGSGRLLRSVKGELGGLVSALSSSLGGCLLPIALIFGILSLIALLLFFTDKRIAIGGRGRRIPEAVLIAISALGGAVGGILGMLLFRHKIRHVKFTILLPIFAAGQVGLILILLIGKFGVG